MVKEEEDLTRKVTFASISCSETLAKVPLSSMNRPTFPIGWRRLIQSLDHALITLGRHQLLRMR